MTKPLRKLVIVADDFGLTESVTKGILKCLDDGTVTDVALMPNGEYFEPAVEQLLQRARAHVGIHLTVVDGERPLAPMERVQKLIRPDGRFGNRNWLMRRAFWDRGVRKQLAWEFRAQIDRVLKSGIRICHLSSHQHIHLFPAISPIAISLAAEYRIPFIRLPRTASMTPVGTAVNIFSRLMRRHLNEKNLRALHFIGMECSGHMNVKILCDILSRTPAPATELMVHPGFNDEYSLRKYAQWRFDWNRDLNSLRSPEWDGFLRTENVRKVSFKELL